MARLYDRNFVLCVVSQTWFMIAWTLSAHYARWISFLGGDQSTIGWIMGSGMTAGVVLRPWIGQWINRAGSRKLWGLGYVLFIVGTLANVLIRDVSVALYVVRFALVLAASLTYGSSLTYLTQNTPAERRTEAIGTFGLSGFTAMLIGPRIGDWILGSGERTRGDFELLFYSIALAMLPALVMLFWLRSTPAEHRSAGVTLRDFLRTVRRYWPGSVVLVQLVFGACLAVPFIFLADFVDSVESLRQGESVGRFFLGYALTAAAIRIVLRKLPEQIGRRKVLLLGLLAQIGAMVAFCGMLSGAFGDIILPGALCGAAHGLVFHTMTSLTLERFPLEVRGSGSALALMALDLGTLVASPILGELAETYGFRVLFVALALASASVAVFFAGCSVPIWLRRARARREGRTV